MSHRPRRDTASHTKEFEDTKKENRKLKAELARTQGRLAKLLNQVGTPHDDENDPPAPLSTEGVECPHCSKPLSVVNLGVKDLRVCRGCGWRKVV